MLSRKTKTIICLISKTVSQKSRIFLKISHCRWDLCLESNWIETLTPKLDYRLQLRPLTLCNSIHLKIKFLKHMFAFIAFTWNANLWMWLQASPVCLNGWCIWRKYSVFLAFKSCFQFMCVKLPSVSKWGGIALTDSVAVNGPHLLLHRRTVHYANQTLWRRWNQERDKNVDRWEEWFSATSICY